MKNFSLLLLSFLLLTSCSDDDPTIERVDYEIAQAIFDTKENIRNELAIESPSPIVEAGKIYTYQNYVFVNDKDRGIHVIDNRIPSTPEKIAYLKVPGNRDIEVRNDILYADSFTDLVLFDVSTIDQITFLSRYEDAFQGFNAIEPEVDAYFDFKNRDGFDPETQVIVGWTVETVTFEFESCEDCVTLAVENSGDSVGQGGSFARFKIVNDYLYAIDNSSIYTFLLTGNQAEQTSLENIGWQIETIFNQGEYLYVGGASGMTIVSIENPAIPIFISEIQHLRGCDPVVVDGDYAYLTLRGGNDCGQNLSVLEVIDISDKAYPFIVQDYPLEGPYGLGFKGDLLYVSDGENGLHIYDKSDPLSLNLVNVLGDVTIYDVIPLEDRLLAIAGNTLMQYSYDDESLTLLSSFSIE